MEGKTHGMKPIANNMPSVEQQVDKGETHGMRPIENNMPSVGATG